MACWMRAWSLRSPASTVSWVGKVQFGRVAHVGAHRVALVERLLHQQATNLAAGPEYR
ncbi:MAG TPA: hypothetical protein VF690_11045 [Hymenobacter sp.]